MKKGWTAQDVIGNDIRESELLTLAQKRYTASTNYFRPTLDAMIRFWKIYRSIKDAVDDTDEPNTGPGYAFGVVEDAVASISESILNSRVPTPAKPRKAQDTKSAENFNAMAGTYFGSGQYQSDYPNSVRERLICGANWEADTWQCQYRKARKWEMVDKMDPGDSEPYKAQEEVEYDLPVKVGYQTRFPSIFNLRPQPRVSMDRMQWLIEREERVAIDDLKQQQYLNAAGEKVPFFDFTKIDAEKAAGKTFRPLQTDDKGTDYAEQLRSINDGVSKNEEDDDDTDQLTIDWHWEVDRMFVVANGKYVIAYIEDLFQKPGIPYRVKVCTPKPHSLYGLGMIEPVENLLYELDDIHILSMRNWVRIVNKMIAYNPESVPYADVDFLPRAGGKIRVVPTLGGSVAGEIFPIDQSDVTKSMLTQESNNKGLIERALGMPDFAQGVEGTKQDHDTLGGLQEIKAQSAKRVASIRRQELGGFQKQMWRMEAMFSQFLIDKTPFSYNGPDGSTAMLELNLWDIQTEGQGFDFPIIYDPAFGDDALARNQKMVLMDVAAKYNQNVLTSFPPGTKPLVELDVIMADTLKAFGYSDTSTAMKRPDGVMEPEQKLQAMLRGEPVVINPGEDMVACYAFMVQALQNPQLMEAARTKQVPQDLPLRIKAHVEQLAMAIQSVLRDPQSLLRAKMHAAQPMGPQGGPGAAAPVKANPREGVPGMSPRVPAK